MKGLINIVELTREEKLAMKKIMAENLPKFRKLLGVTQQKFGGSCGLLRDRLSIIERGATEMTWVQFLSILFVLLFNSKTKSVIMKENLFPIKLYQSLQFLKENELPETYIRINPLEGTAKLEPVEAEVQSKQKKVTLKDSDVEDEKISYKKLIEYIPEEIKFCGERIAKYSGVFAEMIMEYGGYAELTQDICDCIDEAFGYADVGYAFLPEKLWHYNPVTDAETELIQLHMTKGFNALFSTKMLNEDDDEVDKLIQISMDVAISHHELWNGTGFPYGLKGARIPLLGRIYAVCDMYDSILTGRNGEEPMPHDYAVTEIIQQSGKKFDPKLVRIFYLNKDKFLLIQE
jgi:Response regulator containing a CheY-like receiver domain and an HD-GYP domain